MLPPVIVVLMGVSGSGKTTVGRRLAADLDWDFLDADDFHSAANREKMARGLPLTDEDRSPWLAALAETLAARARSGRGAVLACSALRESYRQRLHIDPAVRFVYLKGDAETIRQRLEGRRGHFFNAALLASQFAALEEPRDALAVDIAGPFEATVEDIKKGLGLEPKTR
jgi:gluconokinase